MLSAIFIWLSLNATELDPPDPDLVELAKLKIIINLMRLSRFQDSGVAQACQNLQFKDL